jgi:hemoglobin
MREAHAGLHISQAEFYDLVDTLRQVLAERRVPLGARNELLRLLAPMKRDVIDAGRPGT